MRLGVGLWIGGQRPSGGGGTPSVPVTPPAAFTGPSTVTVSRIGTGSASTFTTDYSEASRKALITPVTTFYVRAAGSNNNDGLTPATAFRSLRLAVKMGVDTGAAFKVNYEAALPGATAIRYLDTATQARSGQATNNATWGAAWRTTDLTQDAIFEPSVAGGVAYSIPNMATRAFAATADPNIYVATGTSTQLAACILDFTNMDRASSPRRLALVTATPADAANPWPEINALYTATSGVTDGGQETAYTLGAMWRDATNGNLFVRTFDNRNPNGDANLIWLTQTSNNAPGIIATAAKAVRAYIEGLRFGGGASVNPAFALQGTAGFRHQVDFVRCAFLGSVSAPGTLAVYGVDASNGCDVILYRCHAHGGGLDNYNYHQQSTAIEIECTSDWAGWDTSLANNGSTIHETCKALSVTPSYRQAQDRCVHDVHGSQRWILGGDISTRRGPADGDTSAAIVAGHPSAAGATLMWIDAVKVRSGAGGAPAYATEVYGAAAASILRYANLDFTPVTGPAPGQGTIASYTP